jgi:hypothetical protein
MRLERFGERAARLHALVDIVEHRLERRVRDRPAEDVE